MKQRCRSIAWLQKQQLQRAVALQECRKSRGPRSSSCSAWARCRSVRGPRSSSCNVRERCWSDAWPQKQQLQRTGALQEHSRSVAGVFRGPSGVAGAGYEIAKSPKFRGPDGNINIDLFIYIYIYIHIDCLFTHVFTCIPQTELALWGSGAFISW